MSQCDGDEVARAGRRRSAAAAGRILRHVVVLVRVVLVALHVVAVDQRFYTFLQVRRLDKNIIIINILVLSYSMILVYLIYI